jgi:hypothetical protein
MGNSKISNEANHFEDLRLAYLENILSPEEKTAFEQHLSSCSNCNEQLEDLARFNRLLEANRDALCPAEWELFDSACNHEYRNDALTTHLQLCPDCRSIVESFKTCTNTNGMPDKLWNMATHSTPAPVARPAQITQGFLQKLRQFISDFLPPAPILTGATAVAIILVIVLYPQLAAKSEVVFSSVAWGTSSSTLMGLPESGSSLPKTRLAMIISLGDFKTLPDQSRIDALYRYVEPSVNARLRYDIISPFQIKEAIETSGTKLNIKQVLPTLKEKLDARDVLVIEIFEKGDRFRIHAYMVSTDSGNIVAEHKITNVQVDDLSDQIEIASSAVLK